MQKVFKHILCLFFSLLPYMMQGQAVSSLATPSNISVGVLPDGMKYYIVTSGYRKGFADFALVQKGDIPEETSREILSSLPHFTARKPYKFLSDNGIGYGPDGYISREPGSTRYDFRGVPTCDSAQPVADSTLMLVFDIASRSSVPQAVIVSGDVDADSIKERMSLFSMMVPKLDSATPGGYMWNPRPEIAFQVSTNRSEDIAAISLTYSTERLPETSLSTVQPLFARTYAERLGYVIRARLKRLFRKEEVPLAALTYKYDDSATGPGDERYTFTAYTSSMYLSTATDLIASTLSDLNAHGANAGEYQDAKDKVVSAAKSAVTFSTDSEYVSQCASAFLYGTSLASKAVQNEFIARPRLSDERELELFNGFVKALLDSASNLTMHYDIPDAGLSPSSILKSFNAAWASPANPAEFKADFGDTLSLVTPKRKARVKLKSEADEPVSGGKLWTFSNGMKVVYRKTSTKGEFSYALLMRGGYAQIENLGAGEGAFVSDMLPLSDIAGMNARDFREMLSANGISMNEAASLSDFQIRGSAPSSKLPLLMRSLLSIATSRTPDQAEFERYREEETLRLDMASLSPRDVNSQMDSIMRPDYFYTDRKNMDNLGDDLPQRTEKYFAYLFSKMADGVLVLVGDLDEDKLKKELCADLGTFETQSRYAQRSRVNGRIATGNVTHMAEASPGLASGSEIGVNIAKSCLMPYNIDNFMSFKIAEEVVRKELVRALADAGASVEVSGALELYPTERLTLYVACRPCRADGLPAGVAPDTPLDILSKVRSVTSNLSSIPLSEDDLKIFRKSLLSLTSSELSEDSSIIETVLVRYGEGKDVVTGHEDAVKSVSSESVRKILTALGEGAGVEYVIL